MLLRVLFVVIAVAAVLLAAPPSKPAIGYAVSDVYQPAPFGQQKLGGLLADRMHVNLEGRLLNVDVKQMLAGFEHRPGKQDWIGEHAGKFLDAAANTYEYTRDSRLRALMEQVAKRLMAAQLPDGYLGTYTVDKRWTSWDVWVHKYDLLGLLAYYRVTGDPDALNACKRIGDLLINIFGEGRRDIIAAGEHVGMAATSVLEPMVYLYHWTGDERYLTFCQYLVKAWDHANGPKIIATINATGSVFKTANNKAYEMLSNLVGLTELYRITGDEEYITPVMTAWTDIRDKRLYLTGTSSSSEHFRNDFDLPGNEESEVGEGCVTVTWMQLTLELLRLTGKVEYAEQLERTVYNQLLAAQDARNGDICYFTPLNGKKKPTPGLSCCVSSEPRGISLIPEATFGRLGPGYAVSLYTQNLATYTSRAHGTVRFLMETGYPESGDVTLRVEPTPGVEPNLRIHFPLRLRVPSWTSKFVATIGDKHYEGKPGEWLVISRHWKKGDTVKISMDMTTRVIEGAPSYPGEIAIQRGPQVLAADKSLNPEFPLDSIGVAALGGATLSLEDAHSQLPGTWLGSQAYSLTGQAAGRSAPLILVPFADAREYRVWLKQIGTHLAASPSE